MENIKPVINQSGQFDCSICNNPVRWELKVETIYLPNGNYNMVPTAIKRKPNNGISLILQEDKKIDIMVPCDKCGYITQVKNIPMMK